METIELASYPPPLIDWLLVCAMWFTGGVVAERLRLDDFADSEYLRSVPHDARDSRQ